MVIKRRMENIFQTSWTYLRQQENRPKISNCYLIIWRPFPIFRRMRACWTRLNDLSIEHLCFLELFYRKMFVLNNCSIGFKKKCFFHSPNFTMERNLVFILFILRYAAWGENKLIFILINENRSVIICIIKHGVK